MSSNDDPGKPSKVSASAQPSPAAKLLSKLAAFWHNISWQTKVIGGLGLLAFGYGLANPKIAIVVALLLGVATYYLREKRDLAIVMGGIAIASVVTGGFGLAIQDHFDEQRAEERAKAARVTAKAQQALAEAEAAKKKEARIQALDGAVSRAEAWISAKTGELTSFHLSAAQGALDAIIAEVAKDLALAREQKRNDIADALQTLVQTSQETFAESRKVVYGGQERLADRLFAEGKFMDARKTYDNAVSELRDASLYVNSPSSFKEWASAKLPEAEAALDKAIRVSELLEAVSFFEQWRQAKQKIKSDIRDLASQEAHTAIILELTRALLYLKALDEMSADENQFVPAKYRSKSFIEASRKEIKRFEDDAQKEVAYVLQCGEMPNHWLVGGGNPDARHVVQQNAHDPDSIKIENCSPPELTKRDCWKYQCNVRGKSPLGAKVLNRRTFYHSATRIEVR